MEVEFHEGGVQVTGATPREENQLSAKHLGVAKRGESTLGSLENPDPKKQQGTTNSLKVKMHCIQRSTLRFGETEQHGPGLPK